MLKRKKFIFTSIVFLIITAFSLYGETVILLSTESSDVSAWESLKYIINNTISLELKVSGYSVLRTELQSDETLQERAENLGASFIIENIYSTAHGDLEVLDKLLSGQRRREHLQHCRDYSSGSGSGSFS